MERFIFGIRVREVSGGEETSGIESCCAVLQHGSDIPASGVLIAPRMVLTVKHAVGLATYVRVPATTISDGPSYEVQLPVPCPDPSVDLALLILRKPAAATPVALADSTIFTRALAEGVMLCGFGCARDIYGIPVNWGYKRKTPPNLAISNPTSLPDIEYGQDIEFVAGGSFQMPDGSTAIFDAETGDSGGPAYLTNDGEVIAVVGIDKKEYRPNRNIYVRVDAQRKWIEKVASDNGIALTALP